MSSLQKNLLKSKLPPVVPRMDRKNNARKDYSPSIWSDYFKDFLDVKIDESNFRVYRTNISEVEGPLVVLLHGGGYNGLSWAVFTSEIQKIIHCQCIAIDFRGHGNSYTNDDDDLSADTLANDIANIIHKMYEGQQQPKIVLMGHSMGGAIAVHIAHTNLIPTLLGMVVIDVVEGTAMESLSAMQSFLRSRPNHFKSIPNAIEWCVRSGQIRNVESAKVSMPGQIVNCETKQLAANELPIPVEASEMGCSNPMSIPEDEDVKETASCFKDPLNQKKYTWRIDLSRSEKFWTGWFENLSEKFLETQVPKLLILAGIDNLDKKLTIGQMQGKFQLQVLARTGHAVHEDLPEQVAETVGSYLIRNRFAEPKSAFVYQMPAC